MRNVFWLNRANPRTSKPQPGRGESLWGEKLHPVWGVSGSCGGLCSGDLSLVLLPHCRHRGKGCLPLTLLEGGGWSLPLLIHDDQRRDFSGGLGLEGAEEKQAQGGSESGQCGSQDAPFSGKCRLTHRNSGRKLQWAPSTPCCLSSDPRGTSQR